MPALARSAGRAALPAAVLLALGGVLTATHADPPTLLWQAPGIENVVCLEPIQDIDGDGRSDIVFESYDAGAPSTDHLFCIRGASADTGQVLWSARPLGGASNGGGYGDNCLRISPDITGDGVQDVLLGTAWGGRSAYVIRGTNGGVLWTFDTYDESPPTPPESGWVYAIDAVPDFTGDGVPEVTFCCGSYNDGIYMMNGATRALIWYYRFDGPFYDDRYVGDVNDDGAAEIAAGAGGSHPYLVCLTGPGVGGNPHVVWQMNYPAAVQTLQPLESIDADTRPEIVVGASDGFVRCHDGATGGTLWTSTNQGAVIMRVDVVGDVNGDDTDDIILGMGDNKVVMLDGRSGGVLWTQWVGTLNGGDTWAVDGVHDVDIDGIPEVAVGSFDTKIYLMNGEDGEIFWEYTTGNRLLTVRGVPDLNGNGSPDVVGGTQKLTTGGIVYALDGMPPGGLAVEGPDALGPARGELTLNLWPNPGRRGTGVIHWSAAPPDAGLFRLQVVSADGRVVHTLTEQTLPGSSALQGTWDSRDDAGRPVPPGVFWVRGVLNGRLVGSQRTVLLH